VVYSTDIWAALRVEEWRGVGTLNGIRHTLWQLPPARASSKLNFVLEEWYKLRNIRG
jgi:hypothetical protein